MTFITVELDKFTKGLLEVQIDLDKLIYMMKTVDTVTEPTQFPPFWTEEWLDAAIKKLDIRALTPENRLAYEMTLSANALAIENEQKKVDEVKNQEKEVFVINLLQQTDFDIAKIVTIAGVPTEFVEVVKQKLALNE